MKVWHEKQMVKFQQSCSGGIEDQEDSFEENLNADYSNFVQRGVDFFGQLFKKTPPKEDIFPENSDENVPELSLSPNGDVSYENCASIAKVPEKKKNLSTNSNNID